MARPGFVWDVPPDQAIPQMMERYTRAVFQSGRHIAYEYAEEMETYAKSHAPWTDRTGDARERLHATVEETGPIGTIVLAHGVEYGLWLEVANGGRFSIIPETIDVHGPRLMQTLQRMMNLGLLTRA
jgi:hypothetical protein